MIISVNFNGNASRIVTIYHTKSSGNDVNAVKPQIEYIMKEYVYMQGYVVGIYLKKRKNDND